MFVWLKHKQDMNFLLPLFFLRGESNLLRVYVLLLLDILYRERDHVENILYCFKSPCSWQSREMT